MLTWEKNFKCHSNLEISCHRVKQFPSCYQNFLKIWGTITYVPPSLPLIIVTQILWYNKYIKIDSKTFCKPKIARKSLNFIAHCSAFQEDGKIIKVWIPPFYMQSPIWPCPLLTALLTISLQWNTGRGKPLCSFLED